jgi:hypothetical protein
VKGPVQLNSECCHALEAAFEESTHKSKDHSKQQEVAVLSTVTNRTSFNLKLQHGTAAD